MEGSQVNSKTKWFHLGSMVCSACNPETSSVNHTIADNSSSSDKEDRDLDDEEELGDTRNWSVCFGK
jgi:hypothetical protein